MSSRDWEAWKKVALSLKLSFLIWVIGDKHLTVFTALLQHEPSARIFRSLLQVDLILFCAAFSLHIWSRILKPSVLGDLLFQPAFVKHEGRVALYQSVSTLDDATATPTAADDDDDDGIDDVKKTKKKAFRDDDQLLGDAADAHYESDGEVEEREEEVIEIPSASQVLHPALNMLLVILLSLFLFVLSATGFVSEQLEWKVFSRIAAPAFPLLLFVFVLVKAILPLQQRMGFWVIVSLTLTAPWHDVTFRDGFIGDVLTSSVRPAQDICFTVFYLLSGLRGWWSPRFFETSLVDEADARVPQLEKSWMLHTAVLPMCMLSPLWWRFLQNLRQCFDAKKRWPYLGNALKYFAAAQVAVFGVFQPHVKKSSLWLFCFVIATLYQIWWDIFQDWGLLEKDGAGRLRLRRRRLYSSTGLYWTICIVNVLLRFCWTLSFVPTRYLDATGVLTEAFAGDLSYMLGPTLASAEIIRRTLWGLLRVEWEAVKHMPADTSAVDGSAAASDEEDSGLELQPMKMADIGMESSASLEKSIWTSDMSTMNDIQILGELCFYATVFAMIGVLAAAHRGTM